MIISNLIISLILIRLKVFKSFYVKIFVYVKLLYF
ncbi:hypothetical protein HERIO_2786 [Hepatospora eriocheir]|uniref:Uncharacterized protein n=1 Tax=Hepatospora eriocheir TaxID=1081669 RepID=A0A1X0Q6X5_9MICR|nr:hypothetical protein HERIO_2786 [Hepatospora eriocheir]